MNLLLSEIQNTPNTPKEQDLPQQQSSDEEQVKNMDINGEDMMMYINNINSGIYYDYILDNINNDIKDDKELDTDVDINSDYVLNQKVNHYQDIYENKPLIYPYQTLPKNNVTIPAPPSIIICI